ncbi:MAG: class I tRNA ligase family protein, partial [Candidatus Altiarchaeota archaeon]|nr:class I tRNA ligase family protein [Candidatus Altiarchaeota archaeon]
LYPMSLRPQAHDIITFWLFNTVVKSRLHDGVNPWADVVISGHAQDPHGRKMSKSKGNVIEPQVMIEKYCADSLRFWAAGCKLGDDLPFTEKDLVTGQKFITKIWNASRFVSMHLVDFDGGKPELHPLDRWLLTKLSKIINDSTVSFDRYEYSRTKADVEKFFWQTYCDYFLEMIKHRLYKPEIYGGEARKSAQYTLYHSLLAITKLMAPIMPHITEELYQLYFMEKEGVKSVHISPWPTEYLIDEDAEKQGDAFVEVLGLIRKLKTDNKLSLAKELDKITLTASEEKIDYIKKIEADLKGAGKIVEIEYVAGEQTIVSL